VKEVVGFAAKLAGDVKQNYSTQSAIGRKSTTRSGMAKPFDDFHRSVTFPPVILIKTIPRK
jgi:hypothetical protein